MGSFCFSSMMGRVTRFSLVTKHKIIAVNKSHQQATKVVPSMAQSLASRKTILLEKLLLNFHVHKKFS